MQSAPKVFLKQVFSGTAISEGHNSSVKKELVGFHDCLSLFV